MVINAGLSRHFSYLEQCCLGGVEFGVAVYDGLHGWGVVSHNQQSGAPVHLDKRGKEVNKTELSAAEGQMERWTWWF